MIRQDITEPEPQQRLKSMNQEQAASSWLTTLSTKEEGYDLIKQFFANSGANEMQLGIIEITVSL